MNAKEKLTLFCFLRNRALAKMAAMKAKIGYPKELLDEENLRKLYDGVRILNVEH